MPLTWDNMVTTFWVFRDDEGRLHMKQDDRVESVPVERYNLSRLLRAMADHLDREDDEANAH